MKAFLQIGAYMLWGVFGLGVMFMTGVYMHAQVIGESDGWIGDESVKNHYIKAWPGGWLERAEAVGDWFWSRMGTTDEEQARRLLSIGQKRLNMSEELMGEGRSVEASMAAERAVGYLRQAVVEYPVETERWRSEVAWSLGYYDSVLGKLEEVSPEKVKPKMTELRYLSALTGTEMGLVSN